MWSDNETAIDLLGFQHLVSAVTSIVREESLLPATIGVFGDWGSGKSSLLKMIEAELKDDEEQTLVLTFNGWLFEGYEDARTALMGSILDAIGARKSLPEKAKELLKKLMARVSWMRVAGATLKHGAAFVAAGQSGLAVTTSLDIAQLARAGLEKGAEVDLDEGGKYLSSDAAEESRRAIREFRADFDRLLDESGLKRLVVVIDDLDRCLPDSIIETLEAIKLFLYVRGTAFVIGADERLVKYAVRRRFPELPGESIEVGREYLEKLIQYPVRIPPLDASEVETYINLLFAKRSNLQQNEFEAARARVVTTDDASSLMGVRFNIGVAAEIFESVPEPLKESLALAERVAPVLAAGLKGNPRQCKRFLNMLSMRLAMAESRSLTLEQRVLAKLMLLEYLKPEWFRRLAQLQADEAGKPLALAELESTAEDSHPQRDSEAGRGQTDNASGTKRKGDQGVKDSPERSSRADSSGAISPEFSTWLADPWMRDWLNSKPKLAATDLRPYFYFSRDHVGPLGSSVRRMTPGAQEILSRLLHESEAQRKVALEKAEDMAEADAAAIFEALATRVSQEDSAASEASLDISFEWVKVRPELRGQMVTLLERVPESRVPLSAVPKVVSLVKGTDAELAGRSWLQRLGKGTAKPALARAAQRSLDRLEE